MSPNQGLDDYSIRQTDVTGMLCLNVSKVLHTIKAMVKAGPDHDALFHLAEEQAAYFTARQAAGAGFSGE